MKHWCGWKQPSQMFFKIGVQNIHTKTSVLESLFVAGLRAGLRVQGSSCRSQGCNFLKKRLQHRCFPVNIAKYLRTPFFTEHLRWLLLCEMGSERFLLN